MLSSPAFHTSLWEEVMPVYGRCWSSQVRQGRIPNSPILHIAIYYQWFCMSSCGLNHRFHHFLQAVLKR